jgi:oligopeptidase B
MPPVQAPIAKQVDHVWQRPTGPASDPWAWLRDRDDPDTVEYLKAENEYSDAWFADHGDLIDTLFGEIKARVQETDLSAPVRKDDWWYVTRTEEGASYAIHCRPQRRPATSMLLDENAEARARVLLGQPSMSTRSTRCWRGQRHRRQQAVHDAPA